MKWGRPNTKGGCSMKKMFGIKGLTYLLSILTLGLLLGASLKWHG